MGRQDLRQPGSKISTERQSCRSARSFPNMESKEIFSGNRGSCQIDILKVDCDYYELLKGNPDAVREWEITGNYLQEYSWAEETCARLEMAQIIPEK